MADIVSEAGSNGGLFSCYLEIKQCVKSRRRILRHLRPFISPAAVASATPLRLIYNNNNFNISAVLINFKIVLYTTTSIYNLNQPLLHEIFQSLF